MRRVRYTPEAAAPVPPSFLLAANPRQAALQTNVRSPYASCSVESRHPQRDLQAIPDAVVARAVGGTDNSSSSALRRVYPTAQAREASPLTHRTCSVIHDQIARRLLTIEAEGDFCSFCPMKRQIRRRETNRPY